MKTKSFLATAAVLLSISAAPAFAAPVSADAASAVAKPAGEAVTTHVQWRRGWHRGWGGPGLGLGLGIIGGAIIANEIYRPRRGYYYDDYAYDGPYYYPAEYHGDPRRICAQNFRSFEWNTGLYTTYSGERRLCPYLR
jgi:hypothetical protein